MRKTKRVMRRFLSTLLAAVLTFGGFVLPEASIEVDAATTPNYRNVVYYGDWSIYAGQKNFYPSKIDGSLITHLNFAFLDVDANGDLVLCDEHADFLTMLPEQSGLTYGDPYGGVLGAMSILRSKYPNMKIGISVGGWTRSGDFPAVAASASKRQNFAKNIAKFVDYLGYDFVDIDWEYPGDNRPSDPSGNGVTIDKGCPGGPEDTKNFTLLMQAIRDELDKLGEKNGKYYELSAAMSASPTMMEKIEYDKILNILDFVNMMTYDLNGAWAPFTAHQTAIYANDAYDPATQPSGVFSIDTCIRWFRDKYGDSIDYSKIVIGVAPYTRGWAGVKNDGRDPKNPGLYATAEPNSVKAADGTTSGTFSLTDIDMLVNQYKLKEYYDEEAQACYYYSAETGYFFTCDNVRSTAAKGAYVKENGLGGLITWMASLDNNNTITRTMKESLYGSAPLPKHEIITANPNVSVDVSASGKTYTITIKNNEVANETNTALKDAELFKETVMFPKLYIETKSGVTFSAGSESGSVTNKDGKGVIDLSSVYAAKALKPGTSHKFTVNVSGEASLDDIVGITMTQRILTNMAEFGEQAVYGGGVSDVPVTPEQPDVPVDPDQPVTPEEPDAPVVPEEPDTPVTPEEPEDPQEPSGGTTEGTGTYPAWKSGETYSLGDLVSYQGKVYECTYAHTSHGGWLPGEAFTLWKERADLVNIEKPDDGDDNQGGNVPGGDDNQGGNEGGNEGGNTPDDGDDDVDIPENNYVPNGKLPAHFVTGYWHNFMNGSTNLKLSDVPSYYDMICVSFTGNTATAGEVTFELDADLCRALGGYTKAEFIQDIKDLKAKGQHVIISVGGAEGRIEINSNAAAELFANGLIDIIEEYGFEGVDIDLEGSAVSGVNYIASALRKVHSHFGNDFIISMAPETYYVQADRINSNDITTAYLRLALEIKDILTVCHPQFYNSGSMVGYGGSIVNPGTADFITSITTMLIEAGLRPDQLAVGVPCVPKAAGSGYVSTDVLEDAILALVNGSSAGSFKVPKAYPTLRGAMTWSINWDATNGYAWAKAMSDLMDDLNNGNFGGNDENQGGSEGGNEGNVPGGDDNQGGNEGGNEGNVPGGDDNQGGNEGDNDDDIVTGETTWDPSAVYTGGNTVLYNGVTYRAKWWTQGDNPETCGQWGPWEAVK